MGGHYIDRSAGVEHENVQFFRKVNLRQFKHLRDRLQIRIRKTDNDRFLTKG
jgi:hypothetical protein